MSGAGIAGEGYSRDFVAADLGRAFLVEWAFAGPASRWYLNGGVVGSPGAVTMVALAAFGAADDLYIGVKSDLTLSATGCEVFDIAISPTMDLDAATAATRYETWCRTGRVPALTAESLRLCGEMVNAQEDGNWTASTGAFTAALTGAVSSMDVGAP